MAVPWSVWEFEAQDHLISSGHHGRAIQLCLVSALCIGFTKKHAVLSP